ncbi:SHOCT domain-containing protein [Geobacter pickeringii]|uniref:SHOCT domain-containing protein n=1 Tax=Geobacter pickeringii TaxID=345632 RepID=UPI001186FE86|nr:SHOCT domain-containing protein [Geobacter pickeringii]
MSIFNGLLYGKQVSYTGKPPNNELNPKNGGRMYCSGCGKDIPFAGAVCPYCQRDKSNDQAYTVLAMILGLGLGYLGYNIFGFWGAPGGFVIGVIIAVVKTGRRATKPPEVNIVNLHEQSPNGISAEDRLVKLQDLRLKGLIDEEEYQKKRQTILNEI